MAILVEITKSQVARIQRSGQRHPLVSFPKKSLGRSPGAHTDINFPNLVGSPARISQISGHGGRVFIEYVIAELQILNIEGR